MILYGKQDSIADINDRSAGTYGEREHEETKEMHEEDLLIQDKHEGSTSRQSTSHINI